MEKKKNSISPERIFWEIERAFYSFKRSPVLAVLMLQAAAFIIIHAKGAGSLYLDMIGILILITLLSWFFASVVHGNQKIVIYTLILLTVGTMLQCIFVKEAMLKKPEAYQNGSSMKNLQMQYLLGFAAAIVMGGIYFKCKKISSMKCTKVIFYISTAVSLVTLIFAVSVGNVKNWIHIGGLSIQTTEITKFLYIFLAAGILGTVEKPSAKRIQAFYIVTILQIGFLGIQSEYGTMLLVLMIFLTSLFVFVADIRVFVKTVGTMALLVLLVVGTGIELTKLSAASTWIAGNGLVKFFLSNYNKIANRFIYWMNPEKDALGLGYQLLKAKESILLGGWFGTSSVTDLPVKTSDLVYPALIQRCGMIFALLVFIVFILMWLEGIRVMVRKTDRYHQMIAGGFICMLFDQTLIIIAGSTGLCPLTGITLPFISSGGSSLLISFMTVGILTAVSGNVKWKGTESEETEEFFKKSEVAAKCYAAVRHFNDRLINQNIRTAAGRLKRGGRAKAGSKGDDV
jgi:cell division protein FtsW (lipid II flippase)